MKENKLSLTSLLTDLQEKIEIYAEWPTHLNSPERSLLSVLDSLIEILTLLVELHTSETTPVDGETSCL